MSDVRPAFQPVNQPAAGRRAQRRPVVRVGLIGPRAGRGAASAVLDFGRYSGWSVAQLAAHDPTYLEWLSRTPIGRPLRSEILASLELQRSAAAAKATAPLPQRRRGRLFG